ncbi:hypothetical protein K701_26960 [Streptomyces fradiae ATCC 10745 = DSM 40063]|uniref:Uncharacterized protein n=1 Tax=Streptomyces fradiae ATCC 10745 = DSM 40063 TaxID=1319510 RepID=A0A1Y2P146_STRFR|nr:hypothetical protein K701_26960 [Streptomyces fradiae ATCC 10745 = DSM 40063]OSY53523.1 hypothetical protein BG846_00797 [Streptomyces fradiae ATCC 10745 = DSM 40063]
MERSREALASFLKKPSGRPSGPVTSYAALRSSTLSALNPPSRRARSSPDQKVSSSLRAKRFCSANASTSPPSGAVTTYRLTSGAIRWVRR